MVVNFDTIKRKGPFVNMSTAIKITKIKINWIILEHTITKRLETCIDINIEIT